MSTPSTSQVKVTKLNEDNWTSWKKIILALKTRELYKFVDPDSDDKADEKQNIDAMAQIRFSMEDDQTDHLGDSDDVQSWTKVLVLLAAVEQEEIELRCLLTNNLSCAPHMPAHT